MKKVIIVDNPFVQDSLGYLRDKNTSTDQFRYYSDRLCHLLLENSLDKYSLTEKEIETPLARTKIYRINRDIVIIPILRAGLSMLPHALTLFPTARVGFAGLVRNEETAIASEYYWNIPSFTHESTLFITDPMLATGGSILHVLKKLSIKDQEKVKVISVISAPEGIKAIHREFPKVQIITASIDESLNDNKYIVPGLGDYGDRYFGTENATSS